MRAQTLFAVFIGTLTAFATVENLFAEETLRNKVITVDAQALSARSVPVGGTVSAHKSVILSAQLPGRVVAIAGEEGDAFDKGDLLVALNDEELYAKRRSAEAQWRSASAALHNAGAQFGRQIHSPGTTNQAPGGFGMPGMFDQMFTNPMSSMMGTRAPGLERHSDIVARGTQLDQARHALEQARFQIEQIDTKLRDSKSIAPFSGVIVRKFVEEGDTVQPGQPLLGYEDLTVLEIVADVPTRLSDGLKEGDEVPAKLHDAREQRTTARLSTRFPTADPIRHTIRMKFALPESIAVAPGSYAEVFLAAPEGEDRTRLAVPMSAVVERGGLPAVFAVNGDNQAELRMVRLGGKLPGGEVVIRYGLESGERILDNPAPYITSGYEITP